jgi:hypothetical protein
LERISQVKETAIGHISGESVSIDTSPKGKGSIELNSQVKGQRRAEKNKLFFSVLFCCACDLQDHQL